MHTCVGVRLMPSKITLSLSLSSTFICHLTTENLQCDFREILINIHIFLTSLHWVMNMFTTSQRMLVLVSCGESRYIMKEETMILLWEVFPWSLGWYIQGQSSAGKHEIYSSWLPTPMELTAQCVLGALLFTLVISIGGICREGHPIQPVPSILKVSNKLTIWIFYHNMSISYYTSIKITLKFFP